MQPECENEKHCSEEKNICLEKANDTNILIAENYLPDLDNTKSCKKNKQSIIQRLSKTIKFMKAREQKLRRENKKLNEVIKRKNAMITKWKMKYHRLLNKNKDNVLKNVKKIERKGPTEIRKKLLLNEAFIEQLKERQNIIKG